ncbi:MAG: Flp family type IVb pilin [Rhizobiaceae bacterium]|nr:Flp family type IVb pilin [Hyphomicrobiales bacterium]
MLRQFMEDESGATVIEYGLIVAVLSLVIIAGFGTAANALQNLLGDDNGRLANALKTN